MCGIIGYIGEKEAKENLLDGLKKLEYRGYDSAGIATLNDTNISIVKTVGKVDDLIEKVNKEDLFGKAGIGHTRWATHGCPNDNNSHPHISQDGKFAIVHNGIIENFAIIKEELKAKGYTFVSETDTEVIAQLLSYNYDKDVKKTIEKTLKMLSGSFALGILCLDEKDTIYAARMQSPLLLGLGKDENFFASDLTALLSHTKEYIDLDDGEIAELTKNKINIFDFDGNKVDKKIQIANWDINDAEKQGFEHYMLKEIYEQSETLRKTLMPRIQNNTIVFENLNIDFNKVNRIVITACGSAFYAGKIGKILLEKLCKIPVESEIASELRYKDPIIDDKTLVICLSQSGETADTIAAIKECSRKKAHILSIVNVKESTIAKISDSVLYTNAGVEIAVASTKAFTSQLILLSLFSLYLANKLNTIEKTRYLELLNEIKRLPALAQDILNNSQSIEKLAKEYISYESIFFIGRNLDFNICEEASLKLKEISYIHSESYAAGELKHGSIALIDENKLVIALCCHDSLLEKSLSNVEQVKARGAKVFVLAQEKNKDKIKEVDNLYLLPDCDELVIPVIEIIPLQLFAYYYAKEKGCDIDKPKNLAKSVTVE